MAKVNRAGKVRKKRRWYKNVGDPVNLKAENPNDAKAGR